jgi:exosome complex RNA-binding protein Csl4
VIEAEAGAGCYTAAGVVYASILGTVKRVPDTAGGTGARVEVARGSRAAALVPTLSSIVLAKVLSINSKQAKVPPPAPLAWWTSPPALNAGPQLVASPRGSPAKLRRQVHIDFRSTARADLGVVHAQLGGEQMGALDQDTLMCPTTRVTKRRKVAMAPS